MVLEKHKLDSPLDTWIRHQQLVYANFIIRSKSYVPTYHYKKLRNYTDDEITAVLESKNK